MHDKNQWDAALKFMETTLKEKLEQGANIAVATKWPDLKLGGSTGLRSPMPKVLLVSPQAPVPHLMHLEP